MQSIEGRVVVGNDDAKNMTLLNHRMLTSDIEHEFWCHRLKIEQSGRFRLYDLTQFARCFTANDVALHNQELMSRSR
jgi:hypothetical protein